MGLGGPYRPLTTSDCDMHQDTEWNGMVSTIGSDVHKEQLRKAHRQTGIHENHDATTSQYANGRTSRASSTARIDDRSTTVPEDPKFEMGGSRRARAETAQSNGEASHIIENQGYGPGIEKSSSQTQLSRQVNDKRKKSRAVQAGSVTTGQGRLWMDATRENETEMYAEYLRGSSATSSRGGVRRRRDSWVADNI